MAKYVKVKFTRRSSSIYVYEIPENMKEERFVKGHPIAVPVGDSMELHIAYITGVSNTCNIGAGIKIKKAYGLVRPFNV